MAGLPAIDNRAFSYEGRSPMSQALFSVIGGTLVNLAKVNCIENSALDKGKVIVSFENNTKLVLDGSVDVVLMKIGGAKERPERPDPTSVPGAGRG
jgi:hypothetical protein